MIWMMQTAESLSYLALLSLVRVELAYSSLLRCMQVDVAELARCGGASGLGRVNVPTLLGYLRGAQVAAAKSKMKKEELVQLVLDHVAMQQ